MVQILGITGQGDRGYVPSDTLQQVSELDSPPVRSSEKP